MSPELERLEDLTIERMLAVKAIRACDGYISRMLWENKASSSTAELLISVQEISEECIAPARKRVSELLIASQQIQNDRAELTPSRKFGDPVSHRPR